MGAAMVHVTFKYFVYLHLIGLTYGMGASKFIRCTRHVFFCGGSTRFRVMAFPYGAWLSQYLDTPHLVGLLWATDRPVAETSN